MTELTERQLVDAITRSLKETGRRMARKYEGAKPDKPAAGAARKRTDAAGARRHKAAPSSARRS